jgi:maintenance of morphology protein 1
LSEPPRGSAGGWSYLPLPASLSYRQDKLRHAIYPFDTSRVAYATETFPWLSLVEEAVGTCPRQSKRHTVTSSNRVLQGVTDSGIAASPAAQSGSSASFAQGFVLGQLTLALILIFLIKFFIFGEPPTADSRAATRAALRRQRTLSHASPLRRRSISDLRLRKRSSAAVLAPRNISSGGAVLTTDQILEKTYYNVNGHQPESLDWFNVLIAQTISQLRADALEGDAVLTSLTNALNGGQRPQFIDEIKVTDISLGEEFPIFSNCRVIPVDENGQPVKQMPTKKGANRGGLGESRLQARMDVDLSDVVTLGIETKLVLNYPKPFSAVLPVALAVSVVRFSGTLSLSFTPSQQPDAPVNESESSSANPSSSPTTLTFTFLDDYRLDLSVHSLIGSRARLQDVPKIAQLVEQRIHAWFDERCVEPRFQQIVLPSLWPRKKNVRGGTDDVPEDAILSDTEMDAAASSSANKRDTRADKSPAAAARPKPSRQASRQAKSDELMTEEERLAAAGEELRAAEQREWSRERRSRERHNKNNDESVRRRSRQSQLAKELDVQS